MTKKRFRWAACFALVWGGLLHAQEMDGNFDPVTLPTSRELETLAGEVDKKAKSGDWRGVVERVQAMLEKHPERVIEARGLSGDGAPERYLGVREFVRLRVAALGAPALEAYRTLYDPFADEILRRTAGEARWEALREILFRYPLVTRAQEYRDELADRHLERGEFEEAIAWLRQAERWGPEVAPGELLARMAFAHRCRGDLTALEALIERASDRENERVQVRGEAVELGAFLARLRAETQRAVGLSEGEGWPTVAANPRRDWAVKGAASLAPVSWSRPIPSPDVSFEGSRFVEYDSRQYREFSYSTHYPIVVGTDVFVSNGVSVSRYNLYNGNRQDFFPGLVESVRTPQEPHLLHGLVHGDGHLYANLEGPTEQSYERWQQFQIQVPIPRRHLVKLSIDQGRVVWDVSAPRAEAGEHREFLQEASFAAPPVRFGDTIYALANHFEGMNKCYLVGIDDATGLVRSRTLLCTGQEELNMFGRPVKELVGTILAAENGVLYVLTNVGVVCAIDGLDGRVLWLERYERIPLPITRYARVQRRDPSWGNCPPILSAGVLVIAPMDSWYAHGYDASTGKKLWEANLGRRCKYLLAVHKDRVVFGGEELLALDLATGRPLWGSGLALAAGDAVAGHGVVAGDFLLVPGQSFLYRVNLLGGSIADQRRWTEPEKHRGHLLLVDDYLIVAGRDQLTAFTDSEHSLGLLERALARTPGDPALRYKLGSLLLRLGRTEPALDHFRRLVDEGKASGAEETKRYWGAKASDALFATYLEMAEKAARPEDAERYYQLARQVVTDQVAEIRLLFQLAAHYASRRRSDEAVRAFVELVEKHGDKSFFDPGEGTYVRVGLKAQIELGSHLEAAGRHEAAVAAYQAALTGYPEARYLAYSGRELARRKIAQLIDRRGREVYRAVDAEARRLFEQAARAQAVGELARILEDFPNSTVVEDASFALAEVLFRDHQYDRASFQIQDFLRNFPASGRRAAARVYLVRAFEEQGMHSIAKAVMSRLAEEDRGKTVRVEDAEVEVDRFVEDRKNRPEYARTEAADAPRAVRFGARRTPVWSIQVDDAQNGIQNVFTPAGAPPEGQVVPFYVAVDGDLHAHSTETGDPLWELPFATGILGMRYFGPNLLVWATDRVVAIEPGTGRLVWEHKRNNYVSGMGAGEGFVAITVQVIGRDQRQVLTLLDSSGKVVWQSEDLPGMSSTEPLFAQGRVIVWTSRPVGLHLFELESGRRHEAFAAQEDFSLPPCSPVLVSGQYVVATPDRQRLLVYDLAAGKIAWEVKVGAIQRESLVANEMYTVVTNTEQGRHEVYDTRTGRLLVSMPVGRGINPKHWKVDWDRLYLLVESSASGGRRDEFLQAFDLRSGDQLWRSELVDPDTHQNRFEVTADSIVAVCDEKGMGLARSHKTLVFVIAKDGGKKVRQMELETELQLYSTSGIAGGRFIIARGSTIHAYGGE